MRPDRRKFLRINLSHINPRIDWFFTPDTIDRKRIASIHANDENIDEAQEKAKHAIKDQNIYQAREIIEDKNQISIKEPKNQN